MSRGVWIATAAPVLIGVLVAAGSDLSGLAGLGVALSALSAVLTCALIIVATRRIIDGAAQDRAQVQAAMRELRSALQRSEEAELRAESAVDRTVRSEERLNLALGMAGLHIFELDYVRRELVKAGAEDTFFSTPKTFEDLADDVYVTIDPRDRRMVKEAWRRHVQDGEPFAPEYRIARGDGVEVWATGRLRVIEADDGRVTAFEIKAASRVGRDDFSGLRQLRERLGSAFVAGVALYTGARSYTFEDRLHVMPIDRLWRR